MKKIDDIIYQLCNQIIKNDFKVSHFYFDENGVLFAMNKQHTAMIKIKKHGWINTDYTPLMLDKSDFINNKFVFTKLINNYHEENYLTLCKFDDYLFELEDYIECTNITPLRKLMDSISNYNVLIEVGENNGVYDTYWLLPLFLNIPHNLKMKITVNNILCLNYDFYGYDVYCCIAAKFIPYEDAEKMWVVE